MHEAQGVVREFADVARRYVAAIDAANDLSPEEFLLAIHPILCELVYRASLLPDVDYEGDFPADDMTLTQWSGIFEFLGSMLGEYDNYWEVFDPARVDDEDPITSGLSDDLADIYRDVAVGLEPEDRFDHHIPEAAIAAWRFTFRSHWGLHAMTALRVIQARIAYHGLGDDLLDGDASGA